MNSLTMEELLGPEGPVADGKEQYEYRSGQLQMAEAVQAAFEHEEVCVIEAGTGIGKSFAYLVPSLSWCMDHQKERIVIATSTINLQHQLFEKDIPFLTKVLKMPVQVSVLKGRGNYLCKRRLYRAIAQRSTFSEQESEHLGKILLWVNTSETGDRSELPFTVTGRLWSAVCSDADSCIGYRCSHKESCFVMNARKRAAASQIVIVNHHVMLADMIMKAEDEGADSSVLLPPFTRLIIDEAHNLEKNAVSYFTDSYDSFLLGKMLNSLFTLQRGTTSGLMEGLRPYSDDPFSFDRLQVQITDMRKHIDAFDMRLDTFSGQRAVSVYLEQQQFFRVPGMKDSCSALLDALSTCNTLLLSCLDSCDEDPENIASLYEAFGISRNIASLCRLLEHLQQFDLKETHVYWLESRKMGFGMMRHTVKITPVDFSSMLSDGIFSAHRSTICTSATLTIGGRFDFWEEKVGIDESFGRSCSRHCIPSPFDYRNRVLMCFPKDAPQPTEKDAYTSYSAQIISKLIAASEGGALVLFTSYAMLNEVYELCAGREGQDLMLLKQGDDSRYRLMQQFVEHRESVLFATQSFWEGVDAPGDTLRLLIVCRLPFSVPTEPVFYAKKLMLEKQGKNSFMELALPEAVIKLKQGFGRLMRTSSDRGVFCMLDSRVVTKRYGTQVISSLPETQRYFGTMDRIVERVEDFLYS